MRRDYHNSNVYNNTFVIDNHGKISFVKTFAERLKASRETAKITQTELAKRVGLVQGAIAQMENGRNAGSRHIGKIADTLGVRALWLETGKGPQQASNTIIGPDIKGRVPLISWVQAGDWASIVDNFAPGEADEWVETTVPIHKHTFALRVNGDSMTDPTGREPTFPHGTKIIVEPDLADSPDNLVGCLVIIRAGDDQEATFKQLVRDGGRFYLKPLNPQYPIMPLPDDAIICGVVREKNVRYV